MREACRKRAGGELLNRQHAEVDQQHLQQIFARGKRVGHERAVGFAAEVPEHGAAQRGLAAADLAGQDEQAFAAANAVPQALAGRDVVRAVVDESRIGVEAERLLGQAEERLVGKGVRLRLKRCRDLLNLHQYDLVLF